MSNENTSEEDVVLNYVHDKRKLVVEKLTSGNKCPDDPDSMRILLTALKDMDSRVISIKRIKVEEKQNNNQAMAAALIAQVLHASATGSKKSLEIVENRVIPILGSDIPEPTLVEDETTTVVASQTYDQFVQKMSDDSLDA